MKIDKTKAKEVLAQINAARICVLSAIVADTSSDAASDLDEAETFLCGARNDVEKIAETLYTEDGDLKP